MVIALIGWLMLPALAQDGFDAHGVVVVPQSSDVRDTVTLRRPSVGRSGQWSGSALLEYSERPLIATSSSGVVTPILDDLFVANIGGRVFLHERISLDVAVPLVLGSRGEAAFSGPAAGDIRVASQVAVVDPASSTVGLGLATWLDLPSGSASRYLGQPGLAGGASLLASLELDDLTLTGNLGTQFNPSVDSFNVVGSDVAQLGLGLGYQVRSDVSALMELVGSAPFTTSSARGTGAPIEGRWYGRWSRTNGSFVLGGISAGLSPGIGAAVARVFLGGGWGPVADVSRPTAPDGGISETVDLSVSVLDDHGRPLEGVEVVLEGGRHERIEAPSTLAVEPGSLWRGGATVGACLEGAQVTQVHDVGAEMVIEMGWLGGAEVNLLVMDAGGNAIENAAVEVRSEDVHCAPQEKVVLGANGSARFEVGLSSHTIVVTDAEGRQGTGTMIGAAGTVTEVIILVGLD